MFERFGEYLLLETIGVGGMAEVFLARQKGVEGFVKELVIKRIRPHLNEQPAFVAMFLSEAKIAAQLAHPNIVQIYDLGKLDDSYFIAMEYVAGRDMSSVVPKCLNANIPFPIEYALKITSSVCEGLHFAHTLHDQDGRSLELVHRDVSPENIRVGWTGAVKILDFGIAKVRTQIHETKAGQVKGKICYMSPEQANGKEIDLRSDIFSLGVVLYECLTGLKLFTGESDLAILQKINECNIHPVSYFRDEVPMGVEKIVAKALAKDRNKRYQTVLDMQVDIDQFLHQHEFTPSNLHLANFMKQLFHEEIQKDQARHGTAVERKPQQYQNTVPLQPMIDLDSPFMETDVGIMKDVRDTDHGFEETSDPLLLRLTPLEISRLSRIAAKQNMTIDQVARDILGHYLKYQA